MFLTRKKFWKRLIISALTLPILLASIGIGLVYYKQDDIVQGLLETVNKDFNGKLEIKGNYKKGKKIGEWLEYHENGQIEKTEIYKDGKLIETIKH